MNPYLGVVGFSSQEDVRACARALPNGNSRIFSAGVLIDEDLFVAHTKRSHGGFLVPSRLAKVFVVGENVQNVIHLRGPWDNLEDALVRLAYLGGHNLDGMEVAEAWPDPKVFEAVHRRHDYLRLMLRVGTKAREMKGLDPRRIAESLKQYSGLVSEVMLHVTNLHGLIDVEKTAHIVECMQDLELTFGIGFSGKLSSSTIENVRYMKNRFPEVPFSVSARSGLQKKRGLIDVEKASTFLVEVSKALS